jgi:hypothetical protein
MWVTNSTACFLYLLLRLFFEPNLFMYNTPHSHLHGNPAIYGMPSFTGEIKPADL